ncbi:gamma-glutamyltransferase [Mariniplasma anaerobium]|uniref:Glutathione hydrolase proenzyme n=1 Tax=Mariniplasma anaerobium TaxID=2735436 RepID=A0A7U9TIU5_9MOLU|nr:gamma-glutamyltransferase [Mariniplasma anaerobium]BCR36312.1 gamma-glutamyltranspeptidase [Mariniplasma anaerobium]
MNKYNSNKTPVLAKHGVVATSEPNAANAGLEILKKGGNAIDAAIATAAALTVCEPTSNGIGGDNFAIIWYKGKLIGMNSSGKSPALLSMDVLKEKGLSELPRFGFLPVTVPGVVKGWAELSKKYGKLSFKEVLAPAIRLAKDGYKISATVASNWKRAKQIYEKNLNDDMFKYWFETFGNVPDVGDDVVLKDHAKSLEDIANTFGDSFYNGNIADKIESFSIKYGGLIRKSDLSAHKVNWVHPISTSYRGYDLYELPPNTQGIIGLMGLNILENHKFNETDSVDTYHQYIESIKLAFSDGLNYIADPEYMKISVDDMLSKSYAKQRYEKINENAQIPKCGDPKSSGTVYLATADKDGNMVSFIQSNYMGFGSGLVVPHTGITLQNRGHNFSMDEKSVNYIGPNKKPYHTIIPGFIMKDKLPVGPFGVMGGFMQPQGHLQVISSMLDFNLDPQEALDRPRFQWIKENTIYVEPNLDESIIKGLKEKGHDVIIQPDLGHFGRGQIILKKDENYIAATEIRCDGTICSY